MEMDVAVLLLLLLLLLFLPCLPRHQECLFQLTIRPCMHPIYQCHCSAVDLRMQALAAAHWQAVQAAEAAVGRSSGPLPSSNVVKCDTLILLPGRCPELVDSAFMAMFLQRIAGLPTVSWPDCPWQVGYGEPSKRQLVSW